MGVGATRPDSMSRAHRWEQGDRAEAGWDTVEPSQGPQEEKSRKETAVAETSRGLAPASFTSVLCICQRPRRAPGLGMGTGLQRGD